MYEVWYDKVEAKYGESAKLCFTDTDNFIVHVKTDDSYKDIAEDVEKRFHISNFKIDKGKYKKVIGLMKDGLGAQILKEFVGFTAI